LERACKRLSVAWHFAASHFIFYGWLQQRTQPGFALYDIFAGNGGSPINDLSGNVYYRCVVTANAHLYGEIPEKQKHFLARAIIEHIHALGGRFWQEWEGDENNWVGAGSGWEEMDMKRTVDKVQKKLAEQVRKKEPPTPPPHQQEPQQQERERANHDNPAFDTALAAVNVSPSSTAAITAPAVAAGHHERDYFYDHDDMELEDEDNNNNNNFTVEHGNVPVAGDVVDPNPVVQDDAAVVAPDVHVNNNVIYDFDDLDMENAEFLVDDFFDSELVPVAGVVVNPNLVVQDDAAAAAPDVDDDLNVDVDLDDLDMAQVEVPDDNFVFELNNVLQWRVSLSIRPPRPDGRRRT
jgi:hypothetical protein